MHFMQESPPNPPSQPAWDNNQSSSNQIATTYSRSILLMHIKLINWWQRKAIPWMGKWEMSKF